MRILIPLLVLCSFASANSSIGGYNYQTPWNYYPYQNYSGWHAPQQTHQSSLSKARQDLTASLTDPMMMVGAGGVSAQLFIQVPNIVCPTTFLVTEQQHLCFFFHEGSGECCIHNCRDCWSYQNGSLSQRKDRCLQQTDSNS